MAPHIDLRIGEEGYRKAYNIVRNLNPELIIILGTGHSMLEGLFSLTEKDFDTPLGPVKTDKKGVRALAQAGKDLLAGDDYVHRSEHSIEFQTIFVKHLFKNKNLPDPTKNS